MAKSWWEAGVEDTIAESDIARAGESVDEWEFFEQKRKEHHSDPEMQLSFALRNLPSPFAFERAAISCRALIRAKRKSGEDYGAELRLLYELAAVQSFGDNPDEVLGHSGWGVLKAIPGGVLRDLPYSYLNLGYSKFNLLKVTDIKWMVKEWGEPEQHSTLKDLHKGVYEIHRVRYQELRDADIRSRIGGLNAGSVVVDEPSERPIAVDGKASGKSTIWWNCENPDDRLTPYEEAQQSRAAEAEGGVFWADEIADLKSEPGKRFYAAMRSLPLPAAFREAAIALRACIRELRKEGKAWTGELEILYELAAVESFGIPYDEVLRLPGYNVMTMTPGAVIRALPHDYQVLGYERLDLLKKTDKKWLVEAWGEPQSHSTMHDMYPEEYAKWRNNFSRRSQEEFERMLARVSKDPDGGIIEQKPSEPPTLVKAIVYTAVAVAIILVLVEFSR